jgi:serine/tyrosine/threonine adenylyltransferase
MSLALPALADLTELRFDDSFVRELPADPELRNVPRPVRNACYTRVDPTPVRAPRLLGWSEPAGELLGIAPPESATSSVADALTGNRVLPGMKPYAARYGGHQFGHWAGQLGDGRAITLGEVIADGKRFELQLKGAGRTPYSRTADGRAVLRSSVREFLCSEAMHHLGVPTTRALSLTATGEHVVRDMFYDGNPEPEPGAVVCRVAPTFVRFGNFEILSAYDELEPLQRLADYVIRQHFPDLGAPSKETYALWFEEICRRTARMVSEWMRVGFVHGVMNTDNMSILGLTIDYGPYGWLEPYDLRWTPNTTDTQGRYCYGNQPNIAQWNLVKLANALYPLIDAKEPLESALGVFVDTFTDASAKSWAAKLGVSTLDGELLGDLFPLLQAVETDMTILFRRLADVPVDASASDDALAAPLRPAFYGDDAFAPEHGAALTQWLRRYTAQIRSENAPGRRERMNRANPKYVLRNYLAQQAIDALTDGDASFMETLMTVLRRPYDEQPGHEDLARRRPEWARSKAGCSALSCSS